MEDDGAQHQPPANRRGAPRGRPRRRDRVTTSVGATRAERHTGGTTRAARREHRLARRARLRRRALKVTGAGAALVVAAGLGTRLKAGRPKALVTLRGAPLVTHAVRRILAAGGVSHVVVVTPATHESDFDEALAEFDPTLVTRVGGGAERSDSVRAGLAALDASCDAVLVHDAARCLAPPSLVARVLAALDDGADAVVPGVAVVDTIKLV